MPAASMTVVDVSSWPLESRLKKTLELSETKMGPVLWNQIKELLSPASLAIMATVTAAWAIPHFFGVGEIADAVMLVGGVLAFGGSAAQIGQEGLTFALGVKHAKTLPDLDRASQHFANFVIRAGVTAVLALFFKTKPKVFNNPYFNKSVEIPPIPKEPGLFYKPTVEYGPIYSRESGIIKRGQTNDFGDILINTEQSTIRQEEGLFHESVHSFLKPKLYFLRNVRVRIAAGGYDRSYLLRYLEESLAQSYAQIRTYGVKSAIYGIKFPVKNGYVSVTAMRKEIQGIMQGPITIGGVLYQVSFQQEAVRQKTQP